MSLLNPDKEQDLRLITGGVFRKCLDESLSIFERHNLEAIMSLFNISEIMYIDINIMKTNLNSHERMFQVKTGFVNKCRGSNMTNIFITWKTKKLSQTRTTV